MGVDSLGCATMSRTGLLQPLPPTWRPSWRSHKNGCAKELHCLVLVGPAVLRQPQLAAHVFVAMCTARSPLLQGPQPGIGRPHNGTARKEPQPSGTMASVAGPQHSASGQLPGRCMRAQGCRRNMQQHPLHRMHAGPRLGHKEMCVSCGMHQECAHACMPGSKPRKPCSAALHAACRRLMPSCTHF
jgi:hypothetical protein